jgi:hypothetical protein
MRSCSRQGPVSRQRVVEGGFCRTSSQAGFAYIYRQIILDSAWTNIESIPPPTLSQPFEHKSRSAAPLCCFRCGGVVHVTCVCERVTTGLAGIAARAPPLRSLFQAVIFFQHIYHMFSQLYHLERVPTSVPSDIEFGWALPTPILRRPTVDPPPSVSI